ncbi:DUF2752 domain-containing protein [Streptomyces sp. PT12]|uniref:DUF2752 domain-containing protein n=1 Tax=Streptomyces sp. PT12 TaxID=1510197 RepID=UPI00215D3904|nr:DUF2752 domain-containing protein [Streptomyces sp. PT12]
MLAAPLAALGAAAAAFAAVAAVDPNVPGRYPPCPVLSLTGLHCPACGGLRSAHALAHGDIVTALGANALAVTAFLIFAVALALWLTHRPFPFTPTPRHAWTAAAATALFTITRNTPLGTPLVPPGA